MTEEKKGAGKLPKRRKKSNGGVYALTEIALMSAVFCVLAPIAMPVPFSPVPITFGTFVLYLTAVVLGRKQAVISVAVYLLIGLAGLPVFSGFTAGFTKLMGPGGGYMIGYLPAVFFAGILAEKIAGQNTEGKCVKQYIRLTGCFLVGAVACYSFGTVWFMVVMKGTYTLWQALLVCVIPFFPFELIKIVLASLIVIPVRQKLKRAGLPGFKEY